MKHEKINKKNYQIMTNSPRPPLIGIIIVYISNTELCVQGFRYSVWIAPYLFCRTGEDPEKLRKGEKRGRTIYWVQMRFRTSSKSSSDQPSGC